MNQTQVSKGKRTNCMDFGISLQKLIHPKNRLKRRFAQEKREKSLESIYWPLSNELKRLVIKQTTIQQLDDAKLKLSLLD